MFKIIKNNVLNFSFQTFLELSPWKWHQPIMKTPYPTEKGIIVDPFPRSLKIIVLQNLVNPISPAVNPNLGQLTPWQRAGDDGYT